MFDSTPLLLALVLGLFGQVAFFADFGRGLFPVWLRVAVHMAPLLPLLFVEPPRAGARVGGRVASAWLALMALSGAAYAGLSEASVALVARGARPPGVWLYLALQAPGSAVALVAAAAATRALRPLRPPPPEPPFVGGYRTRSFAPPLPLPPPPRPAARPPGRWSAVLHLLGSLGFSAVGVFMTLYPHNHEDALMGPFCVALFGFGVWIFGEQLYAGGEGAALTQAARRRALAVLFLLGAGLMYFAGASAGAPLYLRALVGLSGAALGLLAAWAGCHAMKAK